MYQYSPSRENYVPELKGDSCKFCSNEIIEEQSLCTSDGNIIENDHYVWVINKYPKFDGHTMLIPKRHLLNFEDETNEEVVSRHKLLITASDILRKVFPDAGIEVFLQTGFNSEGSIRHLHWHVVPSNPSDQLRGFEKLGYFSSTTPTERKVVIFPTSIKLVCGELKQAVAEVY